MNPIELMKQAREKERQALDMMHEAAGAFGEARKIALEWQDTRVAYRL
jgi:hypothetical protein